MFYENITQKNQKQKIMTQNALKSRNRDKRRGQTMEKSSNYFGHSWQSYRLFSGH